MRIVFTGGGTLGPVTPLLAVIEKLRETHPEVESLWIGTKNGVEENVVTEIRVPFLAITSGKWRRYFSWENFVDIGRNLLGVVQAWKILGRERIDVVVGAGGFVAVPVTIAAWLRRIPVHVHQLDLEPGLANRICVLFARSVSVSFPDLEKRFAAWLKPVVTGTPIRPRVLAGSAEEGRRLFHLEVGVPTVVILGGGTGAMAINQLVAEALPALTAQWQIIHITGRGKDGPMTEPAPRYHPYPFLGKELPHAFAVAEVVVTRAGLGTLAELAALGKPCLIIPIPGSQQERNLAYFVEHGAGLALHQAEATADTLVDSIRKLMDRQAEFGGPHPELVRVDAAERVGEVVVGLLRRG